MAYVHEGHPMMSKVTAMGCTATGIVGAFLAVNSDSLEAAAHAMKAMGIAGEKAASMSRTLQSCGLCLGFLESRDVPSRKASLLSISLA